MSTMVPRRVANIRSSRRTTGPGAFYNIFLIHFFKLEERMLVTLLGTTLLGTMVLILGLYRLTDFTDFFQGLSWALPTYRLYQLFEGTPRVLLW